ncbi:hypothetical protein PZA11_000349 [Diplocarpon coronariae]
MTYKLEDGREFPFGDKLSADLRTAVADDHITSSTERLDGTITLKRQKTERKSKTRSSSETAIRRIPAGGPINFDGCQDDSERQRVRDAYWEPPPLRNRGRRNKQLMRPQPPPRSIAEASVLDESLDRMHLEPDDTLPTPPPSTPPRSSKAEIERSGPARAVIQSPETLGASSLPTLRPSQSDGSLADRLKALFVGEDDRPIFQKSTYKKVECEALRIERQRKALEEAKRAVKERRLRRQDPRGTLVQPLGPKWDHLVDQVIFTRDPMQVCTKSLEGTELRKKDFSTLLGERQWLNDEIINTYVEWVATAANDAANAEDAVIGEPAAQIPKVLALNSFFFERLEKDGPKATERLMKRKKVPGASLLEVETVLIPINKGVHWTIGVVRPVARTIEYFDSMGGAGDRVLQRLISWVKHMLGPKFVQEEWSFPNTPCAYQSNGYDCVNGLAVDSGQSILYTGGRDGAICAWNLNLDLDRKTPPLPADPSSSPDDPGSLDPPRSTTFRAQTQAHTHWVNDIVLAQNNTALVSASSDLTVRVWRPLSNESEAPQTIGQHADYVKCVATPSPHADWVASGGLDRKICLWDLSGAGKKLEIAAGEEETSEKGSVYALSVSRSILASGGPESIVRLWDPRTGKRVTKFVGHTDNIRDILVNESGDTIMTASSDQTIKVWSVTAGRCMHTLTMHNDSVWALFSDDPDLGVFYSSDRSGLVVKTDVRGTLGEMDDGLSLAVAHENEGVNKLLACGDHIWTATSSSSINRWPDVDTGADTQLPEAFRLHRASSAASRPRHLSPPVSTEAPRKEIPAQSVLRISNTARSEILVDPDIGVIVPINALPEETIEGQHGLVKHKLLNDRRRALTLDTAGDVLLWDLLQCIPVQSFGKRHLEDVEPEVNTMEAVAPWCSIDTRTGRLAVVLEEYNCFDAEMYADELELDEAMEFREDQRINLGKWILRHIFSNLIDEMIKRDEAFRNELNDTVKKGGQRPNAPKSIEMPASASWTESPLTPRGNGNSYSMTPGLGIGVATPAPLGHLPGPGDYFSTAPLPSEASSKPIAETPAEEKGPKSPLDAEKETNGKDSNTLFGKKFRMGMGSMSFGSKKTGRSASTATAEKPIIVDEKAEEGSESSENGEKEKEVDDNLFGIVQKIQNEYEKALVENPEQRVESGITPSLPNETPVLKVPPMTTVIIQEETSGGSADLYRGTVATVGEDATLVAERAPMWLGDLLLRNKIPLKEPVKVSFVLQPWQDLLPSIAGPDGNSRLNANRMLRVKKILAYVAERVEAAPEEPDPDALRPEEYLELYCYDQARAISRVLMTLATLRAHIWKGGADVMLYYKSNGRKHIAHETAPELSSAAAVPESATSSI